MFLPQVAVSFLKLCFQDSQGDQLKSATEFNLADREHEILSMLLKGLSYKMIAAKCNVSYSTVNSHISHIYQKLHVKSGTEAVAKAIDQKIV